MIIQPDILADQIKFIQLNKEYKDLKTIVEKAELYKLILLNKEEAESIKNEKDPEMVDMAKLQLEESQVELLKIEEEIKYLLIPKILMMERM